METAGESTPSPWSLPFSHRCAEVRGETAISDEVCGEIAISDEILLRASSGEHDLVRDRIRVRVRVTLLRGRVRGRVRVSYG